MVTPSGPRTEAARLLPRPAEGAGWPRARALTVRRKCHLGFGHRFRGWRGHPASPHPTTSHTDSTSISCHFSPRGSHSGGSCWVAHGSSSSGCPTAGPRAVCEAISDRLEPLGGWKFSLHPSSHSAPQASRWESVHLPSPHRHPIWPPRALEGRAWELGLFLSKCQHWQGARQARGLAGRALGCSPQPPCPAAWA